MKQIVYTCSRCKKQEAVDPNNDDVPMEWAVITYDRIHTVQQDGQPMTAQTTLDTHVCGDCAYSVLDYIEQQQETQKSAPKLESA